MKTWDTSTSFKLGSSLSAVTVLCELVVVVVVEGTAVVIVVVVVVVVVVEVVVVVVVVVVLRVVVPTVSLCAGVRPGAPPAWLLLMLPRRVVREARERCGGSWYV